MLVTCRYSASVEASVAIVEVIWSGASVAAEMSVVLVDEDVFPRNGSCSVLI